MTKEEFITRQQAERRTQRRFGFAALAVLILALGGTGEVADRLRPRPATLHDPVLYGYAFFMLLCAVGIAVPIVLSGRSYRKHGLVCPACGKPLFHIAEQIAIASGHCGRCGSAVFDATPPA